jgi:hypothetical protein
MLWWVQIVFGYNSLQKERKTLTIINIICMIRYLRLDGLVMIGHENYGSTAHETSKTCAGKKRLVRHGSPPAGPSTNPQKVLKEIVERET